MSEKTQPRGGIGLLGGFLLLFVGLKLAGAIDWSWWWVLSPLWGAAVFALVVTLIVVWASRR